MHYTRLIRDCDQQRTDRGMIDSSIGWSMRPYTGLRVSTWSPWAGVYTLFEIRLHRRRGDEVLPRMCAQLSRRRETRTIGRVFRWAISPVDVNRPPPMVQLMPTKVLLTLLLSFHVFLTHKHAMFQVLVVSWPWRQSTAMAAARGRAQR